MKYDLEVVGRTVIHVKPEHAAELEELYEAQAHRPFDIDLARHIKQIEYDLPEA
jgi:hypothetical protein